MTRAEHLVPVGDRYLVVPGSLASDALAHARAGLPADWPETSRCVFVHFAYAELPIGKTFDLVFPRRGFQTELAIPTCAVICAVTQQYGKPFDEIPHGWKTICVIDFPRGVPRMVDELKPLADWYGDTAGVVLCEHRSLADLRRPVD